MAETPAEKRKKRYKLRNLEIDRVDHVDRGANQHADIVFFKRDDEVEKHYGPGDHKSGSSQDVHGGPTIAEMNRADAAGEFEVDRKAPGYGNPRTSAEKKVAALFQEWQSGKIDKWSFYPVAADLHHKGQLSIQRLTDLTGIKPDVLRMRIDDLDPRKYNKNSPDLNEVHQTSVPPSKKKKRKKTPTEELAAMNDLIAKAAFKAAENKKKKKPPFPPEDEKAATTEDETAPKPAPKFPPGQDPNTLPGAEKKPADGGLPGSTQQKPVQRPDGVTAPAPNPFAQKPKPPVDGALGQSPAQAGLPGRPAGLAGMPPPGADKTSQLAQMAEQKAGGPAGLGAGGLKPPMGGPPGAGLKPPIGGEPPLTMESAAGGKTFNFYFSAEEVEKRLDDVLDTVVEGMVDSGVFVETATGEDLRDMLPEDVISSLRKTVSAESADTTPEEDGMALEETPIPDETVEYVKQLEGQVTELSKALEDFVYADEDPETVEFEKALSELPPEVAAKVRADNEKLAAIEKSNAEEAVARADAEYIAKARAFDGVVENPETFGPQLRQISEIDPALAETIERTLASASDRIMKGDLFAEVGHRLPGDTSGAWEKATTIAKSMVEAGTSPSVEVARAEVWEQNPDLYDEYQSERSQA